MSNVPTPHNSAKVGDFASTVIMPGDPKRAKFIADNFLTDAVLVNDVRGVQGYTGFYNGKRVSVMAHGMGMPSISIYAYELFKFYGVKNIIRVGTCGAMVKELHVGDVVVSSGSMTNSNIAKNMGLGDVYEVEPSKKLFNKANKVAKSLGKNVSNGKLFTNDVFYNQGSELKYVNQGVVAVEMESFALLLVAKSLKKSALAIATISDSLVSDETSSAEDRQQNFMDMVKIALEVSE